MTPAAHDLAVTVVEILAASPRVVVRRALAANAQCPPAVLHRLAYDDQSMVRRAAADAKTHYAPNGLFEFQEFDGGHEWRGDIAWAFLRKHL